MRNRRGRLQPPIDDIDSYWTPQEKMQAESMLTYAIHGSPDTVRRKLQAFVELTRADELMVVSAIYDHQARLRSYEILSGLMG